MGITLPPVFQEMPSAHRASLPRSSAHCRNEFYSSSKPWVVNFSVRLFSVTVRTTFSGVLGEPLFVPQAAEIGGKHLPQIHARSEAICSKCAPRYTKQKRAPAH
jgi:hypothetical protein